MARFAVAAALAGQPASRKQSGGCQRHCQGRSLPIIGIQKRVMNDGKISDHPSFDDARTLAVAGASIIALDCTARGRRYGALERLRQSRAARIPVMADIATLKRRHAQEAGADLVALHDAGLHRRHSRVRWLSNQLLSRSWCVTSLLRFWLKVMIDTPRQAAEAIRAGAFAVIVGTAITRPEILTSRIWSAIRAAHKEPAAPRCIVGIDLGGTNTKSGVVSGNGVLSCESVDATPSDAGGAALIDHLKRTATQRIERAAQLGLAPEAIGVATAGWVDPALGRVVYSTGNLSGWGGTPIAEELREAAGHPVIVENDANALAMAERRLDGPHHGMTSSVHIRKASAEAVMWRAS